jgi:beta-galactosidase beta subunit
MVSAEEKNTVGDSIELPVFKFSESKTPENTLRTAESHACYHQIQLMITAANF